MGQMNDIDKHLDAVLRASGSALRHYTLPGTLAAMRAAMAEAMRARAREGWVPVSERMPEHGQRVLAWKHGWRVPISVHYLKPPYRQWVDEASGIAYHSITHWMTPGFPDAPDSAAAPKGDAPA